MNIIICTASTKHILSHPPPILSVPWSWLCRESCKLHSCENVPHVEHPSLPIKFAICNAPFSNTLKTGDLVKTRQWLLIVHDFAGPFWLNCMDLPGFFTQWWVVCSNVSGWARKTLHKQFKHKKTSKHTSQRYLLGSCWIMICEVEYWTATKQN